MIFKDYSRFQKIDKEIITQRNQTYIIKFKDGTVFKQITTFEQVDSLSRESQISTVSYGAWFASEKDAVFLTLNEINELNKNNEIELK